MQCLVRCVLANVNCEDLSIIVDVRCKLGLAMVSMAAY